MLIVSTSAPSGTAITRSALHPERRVEPTPASKPAAHRMAWPSPSGQNPGKEVDERQSCLRSYGTSSTCPPCCAHAPARSHTQSRPRAWVAAAESWHASHLEVRKQGDVCCESQVPKISKTDHAGDVPLICRVSGLQVTALAVQPRRVRWVNSNRLDNCAGFPRFTGSQFRSASTSPAPISHA